jgi:hypothetical protein
MESGEDKLSQSYWASIDWWEFDDTQLVEKQAYVKNC